MKKILVFCILLVASYCFAQDVDISVGNITFPEKIYLRQKATISIDLLNNSGHDIENCMLTIEADDGSKVSQLILLGKDGQTAELKWFPQRQGKIEFKVRLSPPLDTQEKDQENNQVTKTVEVSPS